jgi:hypothetical protein
MLTCDKLQHDSDSFKKWYADVILPQMFKNERRAWRQPDILPANFERAVAIGLIVLIFGAVAPHAEFIAGWINRPDRHTPA